MSPERARQVANGILTVAGVALAVVVWRQPALRRLVRHFAPIALREIRPVHIAAAMAAIAAAPAAAAGAVVAADGLEPDDARTLDAEPIDVKPIDSKAIDVKPIDAKVNEARPSGGAPGESKPLAAPGALS